MQASTAIVIQCSLSLCASGACVIKCGMKPPVSPLGSSRSIPPDFIISVQMSVSRWICGSFSRCCRCALRQDLLHNTGSTKFSLCSNICKESVCSAVEKSSRSHPELIRYQHFVTVLASHPDAQDTFWHQGKMHKGFNVPAINPSTSVSDSLNR